MKKPTLLILAAWILHAAAWFLPSLKAQGYHQAVPGWKATRLAACAIWPCGWSAWVAAAAFVFYMHWMVIFGPQRSQLAVGYFVWLLSFLLLSIGLFVSSRIVLRQGAGE